LICFLRLRVQAGLVEFAKREGGWAAVFGGRFGGRFVKGRRMIL
jgi:hypothetical protein